MATGYCEDCRSEFGHRSYCRRLEEPPLDCRVMPLAAQLRALANSKNRTVAWESQARMLMKWAADAIDAANEAVRHNVEVSRDQRRTQNDE